MSAAQDAILSGSLLLAIPVALTAGTLSFFTPCSLPLVPGYLSYVAGMAGSESPVTAELRGAPPRARRRAVVGAVLFVAGFAAVFASYGALFGSLGSTMLRHQDTLIRFSGALTIVLGLLFAGASERIPLLNRSAGLAWKPRVGLAGAPVLGVVFGIGWTPCIGPALAAVLTLSTTAATAGRGALLSLTYAVGLGLPFILAATSLTRAMRVFAWVRARTRWITRGGGAVLVIIGVLQLTGVWSSWIASLQTVVAGWQAPL